MTNITNKSQKSYHKYAFTSENTNKHSWLHKINTELNFICISSTTFTRCKFCYLVCNFINFHMWSYAFVSSRLHKINMQLNFIWLFNNFYQLQLLQPYLQLLLMFVPHHIQFKHNSRQPIYTTIMYIYIHKTHK